MDPNATIAAIIADGITQELAAAYNEWTEFGGFRARVRYSRHEAGTVVHVGPEFLHVAMDNGGAVRMFHPFDLIAV